MRLIGSDIYAEFADLLDAGISKGTIEVSCNRNRSEEIKSWVNIPDPLDGRKVLILLDSIPKQTRDKLLSAYDADSLAAWAKDVAMQQLPSHVRINPRDIRYFRSLTYDDGRRYYSDRDCDSLAQAAAWLSFLSQLPRAKSSMQRLGYESKRDLLRAAHKLCSSVLKLKGLDKISNFRKFQDKITAYQREGADCLHSSKYGNSNSRKLTPDAERLLRKLYKQHQKFDFVQIWEQYHDTVSSSSCEAAMPEISLSTVKGYLRQPSVRMLCAMERHGIKETKNLYEPTFHRRRPSYPHALWVMDGSPIELYYLTAENSRRRLYGFMVMDAATWHIVGTAIGDTETEALVFLALREAATSSGYLPDQLLFDNSSAIKSKDMMEWYETFARYRTPAQVGNAKTKIIEPAWRQFNEQCLRQYDNYAGANITAKRLDSRVNDEWLRKNKDLLPDQEGVLAQFHEALSVWNLTHPLEGDTQAIPLTLDLRVSIFWKWRMKNREERQTYTYTKDGLTIQIAQERYTYVVYAAGGKQLDYEFWRQHAGKRFHVKYDQEDMSMIALYEGDHFTTYAEEVKRMPMAIVDYEEGEGERVQAAIAGRKAFWQEMKDENEADAAYVPELVAIDAEGYAKAPYPISGKQKDQLNASMAIIKEERIEPRKSKKHPGLFGHIKGDLRPIEDKEDY